MLFRFLGPTEPAEKIVKRGIAPSGGENVVVWDLGGGGGFEAGDAVENVVVVNRLVVDGGVDGVRVGGEIGGGAPIRGEEIGEGRGILLNGRARGSGT